MNRSKERGKAVDDLTPEELQRELRRCHSFVGILPNKTAKLVQKRILQIERRLADRG